MSPVVFSRLVECFGSQRELAAAMGVSPQAVTKWQKRAKVPATKVLLLERLANERGCTISRHELRPDIFGLVAA